MKQLTTFAVSAVMAMSFSTAIQASADQSPGAKVFNKCKICHSLEEGKRKIGPSLYGLFGRTAGTAEGYKFSSAMAASGIVWGDESLTAFLKSPRTVVKGTKMAFPGLKKSGDIEALLTYLHEETAE
jgi:cytochrome c2